MQLSEHEEKLSHVKRWSIVRTIQSQSVAEHSYRVALIAARLALLAFEPRHRDAALARVYDYALRHDAVESITGDIPTPASRFIDKERIEGQLEVYIGAIPDVSPEVERIVKIADLLEAVLFLMVEESMGNRSVEKIRSVISSKLRQMLFTINNERMTAEVMNTINGFNLQIQNPLVSA
jgi:5'-deoxynucleotidase